MRPRGPTSPGSGRVFLVLNAFGVGCVCWPSVPRKQKQNPDHTNFLVEISVGQTNWFLYFQKKTSVGAYFILCYFCFIIGIQCVGWKSS